MILPIQDRIDEFVALDDAWEKDIGPYMYTILVDFSECNFTKYLRWTLQLINKWWFFSTKWLFYLFSLLKQYLVVAEIGEVALCDDPSIYLNIHLYVCRVRYMYVDSDSVMRIHTYSMCLHKNTPYFYTKN
jgi:hypothetical protein